MTESATAASAGEGPTALRLELRTDRAVYAVGEPVELTLAATNPGLGAIAVLSPSSPISLTLTTPLASPGFRVW
jgi:hypothetical protein